MRHARKREFAARYFRGEPLFLGPKTNATFWNRGTAVLEHVAHAPVSGRYEPSPWGHAVAALAGRVLPLKPLTGHGFTTGPAWRAGLERATARVVVPLGALGVYWETALLDPWWIYPWLVTGATGALGGLAANRTGHFRNTHELSAARRLGRPAVLPDVVRWADRTEFIRTLPEGVFYLGDQLVNGKLAPLTHSINGDAPHVAVSMSTGRGKSELYRSLLPQLLRQGADADVIDMKKISLHEFEGQPGVRICRDIDAVPAVITNFKDEMDARYDQLVKLPKREHPALLATYKRRVLTFEEMNTFALLSKAKWMDEKLSGDPRTEPWMRDLIICGAMARQVKMHILMAGQRLDAKATGDSSGNFREMIAAWVLSNPTRQMWKMAGGDGKPPTSDVRGRHVLKRNDSVVVYQGVWAETDDEVLDFMLTRSDGGTDVLPVDLGQNSTRPVGTTKPDLGQTPTLLTVREVAARLGIGVEAARSRAKRGEFGEPIAHDLQGAGLYANPTPSYDPSLVLVDTDDE